MPEGISYTPEEMTNRAVANVIDFASQQHPDKQSDFTKRTELAVESLQGKKNDLLKSLGKVVDVLFKMPSEPSETKTRELCAKFKDKAKMLLRINSKDGIKAVGSAMELIDKPVEVSNLAQQGARDTGMKVSIPESMKIPASSTVVFHRSSKHWKFLDAGSRTDQIIIGGVPYQKSEVQKILLNNRDNTLNGAYQLNKLTGEMVYLLPLTQNNAKGGKGLIPNVYELTGPQLALLEQKLRQSDDNVPPPANHNNSQLLVPPPANRDHSQILKIGEKQNFFSSEVVKYDNVLNPPTLFKANSEGWMLVSRDMMSQGDLILCRINEDKSIDYKSWPESVFCTDNNISTKVISLKLNQRYYNPQQDDSEPESKWTYSGVVDGRVVLTKSVVQDNGEPLVENIRLTIEEFTAQREKQGLENVLEGKHNQNYIAEKPLANNREFYKQRGVPLKDNIVLCKHARFLPDVHAGHGKGDPFGDMLNNRKQDELIVFQELIDRGADQWAVIDKAVEMVNKGEAVYNLGNHEGLFLAAMAGDMLSLANWLMEGGDQMLRECPGFANELNGFDKKRPLDDINLLNKVIGQLNTDPRLDKVREFNSFLINNGKMYQVVDGVLGVHAGIPSDRAGNLIPMKNNSGQILFNGVVGMDLLNQMQSTLRSGNKQHIIAMFAPGEVNEDTHPLWMRDSFFDVVYDKNALSNMRAQLNQQLLWQFPDGNTKIELIVVGHSPHMVDKTAKTHSLVDRIAFIDGGFYANGTQRIMKVDVPDDLKDSVEVTYSDPSGRNKQVNHCGVYPL